MKDWQIMGSELLFSRGWVVQEVFLIAAADPFCSASAEQMHPVIMCGRDSSCSRQVSSSPLGKPYKMDPA